MKNTYMTDKEYSNCFINFWGIREKISTYLTKYGISSGVKVVDVPAGHGYFSFEIARIIKEGEVHAIGLENDLKTYMSFLTSLTSEERQITNLIKYHVMDTRKLDFPSGSFDFVVNFLGLEDINMTCGMKGVIQSLSEFVRVLKQDGIILLTLCLEGNDEDQNLAKEINEFIGHNAVFYPKMFYISELEKLRIRICEEKWYYTGKKMTAIQAAEELSYTCSKTAEVFRAFNVRTVNFKTLWEKFKNRIKKYGVAYYSELCILIGKKSKKN